MSRNQSRDDQRARAAHKSRGPKGKYTELSREKLGPRGAHREPVRVECARRLAAQLRVGGRTKGDGGSRGGRGGGLGGETTS